MTAIVYPSTLPNPTSAPMQWAERRVLSALPGPRKSRVASRDQHGTQSLEFIFLNGTQLQTWVNWLSSTLTHCGAWFSASWPQPQGGVGVRRFIGAPTYPEYFTNVGWKVQAQVQIRGRGELPLTPSGPIFWGESSNPNWAIDADDKSLATLVGHPNDTGDYVYLRANRLAGSGKVYFEFDMTDSSSSSHQVGGPGFIDAEGHEYLVLQEGTFTRDGIGVVGFLFGDGRTMFWSTDIVRFAIDFDTGVGWLGKNSQWMGGNTDPDTIPGSWGPADAPVAPIRLIEANGASFPNTTVMLNTAVADFEEAQPAGFAAIEDT